MSVTKDDVRKIARLSRIAVPDDLANVLPGLGHERLLLVRARELENHQRRRRPANYR